MGCGASALNHVTEEYPSFYTGYIAGLELGRGSFGTVLSASNKAQTEQFAVKLQKASTVGIKNIKYEAELCLALQDHDNIVKFHAICQEVDIYFFIMERCLGTFRDRLMDAPKWTIQELRSDFSQMLHGLQFLHSNRIVHRDIKAENVLYGGPDGKTLKLADFGLARVVGFTQLTSVCGTTSYMAPEMLSNEGYRMPADIWSFGVLCYLTVTGECPCGKAGDSKDDIKKAILDVKGEPDKLQLLAHRVQTELDQYRQKFHNCDNGQLFHSIAPTFGQQTEGETTKLNYMILRTELVSFVRSLLQRQAGARATASRALSSSFLNHSSVEKLGSQLGSKLLVNRPPVPRRTKACAPAEEDIDSLQDKEKVRIALKPNVKDATHHKPPIQTQNLPSISNQKGTFGSRSNSNAASSSNRLGSSSNFSSYGFGRNNVFDGMMPSSGHHRGNSSVRSLVCDMPPREAFAQLRQWHQEIQSASPRDKVCDVQASIDKQCDIKEHSLERFGLAHPPEAPA